MKILSMAALMTFLLLSIFLAMGGTSYALTMQEAVDIAFENSPLIRQYGNLELYAREGVGAQFAGFLPSLDLGYSYSETDEALSLLGTKYSVVSATLSYNLFYGMSNLYSLREARATASAASYLRKSTEEDVALAVKAAFIGVLRARRAVDVAQEGVDLLERQRHDAALFYREGLIAKNELLRVDVELSSARQDLLEAEGSLRVGRKALQTAMGAALADEEVLVDVEGAPEIEPLTREALAEEMLARRSELRYLNSVRDSYEYAVNASRGAGYLPRVDLSLSYEKYGDSTFPDDLGTTSTYDSRTMVSATWNLFDGLATTHGVRAAVFQLRAKEDEISETRQQLLLQLDQALEAYKVAGGRLDAAAIGVSQAEENYRVTENRLKQSEAATVDLLDARFFLARAKNQYNDALYDLHEAVAEIERVVERGLTPMAETP